MTFDTATLRRAFGRFQTGVTIVTTRDDTGAPVGFTANSFTSVSLDPPLLLVCPGNHLSSFETFCTARTFAVSILAEGQEAVSNAFASSTGDRFEATDWEAGQSGLPLIIGRAAGFQCKTVQVVPAGDHVVLIGQVTAVDDAELPGLGYGPDGYFSRTQDRLAEAPVHVDTRASVLLEGDGGLYMTPAGDLPGVTVATGDSPLSALQTALAEQAIGGEISVVYAIYDETARQRRIVYRGRLTGTAGDLIAHPFDTLDTLTMGDPALASLLRRFAAEHRSQRFGLYYGTAQTGDVLPASERG